ncbi:MULTISPECIES: GatB/YqeY domain-containing protein [Jonquetella]|uniref:GatB/YqeY domain-containing protein n=1 Tax=Jonquetella anthropi DSM 22815 TaxID=885272 RepID=H0UM35_9BACT|nr:MULTISPECIES: GatB/YqeY domain-containing protein [Jonquetella]EHM13611.1 hypothetical protein JonanDRAFT_1245 [Jonquetella anthropi DSM 22815]ERL24451.1 YqeY-like protein [Jonquetella sp. BV3C21]
MSTMLERICADLKTAMKSRQDREVAVLRLLKSEAQKLQADKGVSYQITDEDVQQIVRRQIKQRQEAAEQYAAGGAQERADDELAEAKILEGYLPPQMSRSELEALVQSTLDELGLTSPTAKDMGRIMGAVMPKVKGKADGTAVRAVVSDRMSR